LLEERRSTIEVLTAIKRAGANIIITYHGPEAARRLREEGVSF
jgi:porphobilinogen synthase